MGMHLGSGGQENTVKTHKNDGMNFHLKGGSSQGPTKQSWALSAEGSHRGRRLAQIDGVVAGTNGRAACSLPVQIIEWELREQQVWQRPCNKTPPSLSSLNLGGT